MPLKRIAVEDTNTNIPLPYEPDAGEGLAPWLIPEDEFEEKPFPTTNPFHYNENLIDSSRKERIERLARKLIGI